MKSEKVESKGELAKNRTVEIPAVETFSSPESATEAWPESIAKNETFTEQIKQRQELNARVNDVFNQIPHPDISFQSAVEQGYVTENQVEKVYESLSDLLESGKDYRRIILYLPFELLPNKKWEPSTSGLDRAAERFRKSYMESWKASLSTQDVRANFVDGDVLEVNQRKGDLPRVVKSAHLLPILIEKGYIDTNKIIDLIKINDNPIFKQSVADTLVVIADLNLVSTKELKTLEKLVGFKPERKNNKIESKPKEIKFEDLQAELSKGLSEIESQDYSEATEKRKKWLKEKQKQTLIETAGDKIFSAITNGQLTDSEVALFTDGKAEAISQQALVNGIEKAIETLAKTDPEKAQDLYIKYKESLLKVFKQNNPEVQEAISVTLRKFNKLGIAKDQELAELNITSSTLEGPFSKNLESMDEELNEIQEMITEAESDPELSKLIYPTVLVYGSRLKGYGEKNADIDLAVFVKTETKVEDREKLKVLLKKTFKSKNITAEVAQFWLDENGDQLKVRDFSEFGGSLGKSHWSHILFGAAWEGDKDAIKELREKLLTPYMSEPEEKIRARSIEELERDTLQYRLMHKGYGKFFPEYGGIKSPNKNRIDGNSLFWDSGYRRLATKLFCSRVFLPKLPVPEK